MPAPKEIRNRIKATQSTQKTMRAMEMVAASKMRKANERMARSKPYSRKIREVIRHLATSHSEYQHGYMIPREVKTVGVIVISTDRGLCGGLNINLFKTVVKKLKAWEEQGVKAKLCIIGSKGRGFFARTGGDIVAAESNIGDEPTIQDVYGIVNIMIDAFDKHEVDEVHVCSNEYVTTMVQKPTITKLLPLEEAQENEYKHYWDYIYEPDSKQLLDAILKRYIEIQVYQAAVENFACQQAATMVAMKSASDNAGELIKEFQLAYNKARQAAITQEIAEIVGGAAAV